MSQQLKTQAEQKMHEVFDKIDALYNRKLRRPKSITWFTTGSRGGYAQPAGTILGLHYGLLIQNPHDMVHQTVPHEVCHLAAEEMWGGEPEVVWTGRGYRRKSNCIGHGPRWKMLMIQVGCDPKRCHSMDTSDFSKRREHPYIYKCRCRERGITKARHNKIVSGRSSYHCRDCKQTIQFVRVDNNNPAPKPIKKIAAPQTTAAPKAAMKPVNKPERKSDKARNIIRQQRALGTSEDQIVQLIAKECDLSMGLARTYYKNNLAKI
jgi:SprT protein